MEISKINTVLRNRSIGALAVAAALLAGACRGRSDKPVTATYHTHDGRVVHYTVAPEARLLDVAVTAAGGRTIIHFTTGAPVLPSGGPLAIDVHFSDHREIAFVRNFTYPCPGRFDRAAVLDARTGAILGKVDIAINGSRLELAFDSALVTGEPRIAVSRYLPSREALREALGGLSGAYATMRMFGRSGTMYSAVPFAGATRVTDSGIVNDTRFGPPPGTTNYQPTTPVIQIPSGDGTIDVVDHDSNWPEDGDYDTGFRDGCDHRILCGWFTWKAKVSFVGGCGADLDADGRLDGNEVQSYFGYCKFPSAVNDTWQDVSGNIHWRNVGREDDAGQIYEYAMKPATGEISVRYSKNSGAAWDSVYTGPARGGPGGWKFFPAPSPMPAACTIAARWSPRTGPPGAFDAALVAN
jgi:hypothetical protein